MSGAKRKIEDIYYNGKKLSKILSEYYERGTNFFNKLSLVGIDLSNTMLLDITFNCINLEDADLTNCLFIGCSFNATTFKRCNFTETQFSACQLRGCNLKTVTMASMTCVNSDFSSSDFTDALLDGTDFKACSFEDCFFSKTTIKDTKFFNSNLFNATFGNTCTLLKGNSFDFSNISECLFNSLPCEPAAQYMKGKILTEPIIGYKKCEDGVIVKLEIPRGAIVFSINGRKCRTNKAKVIEIIGAKRAMSTYTYMTYYVGDEFTIYDFNCQYNYECSSGIHFFTTREEAESYQC